MNKTIYMTYYKQTPEFVKSRWSDLNQNYKIELSLDNDCYEFLQKNFNIYVAELFKKIPEGMYKADLWRLCKLYINGGIYADVDLIPYLNLDILDSSISFYSCLGMNRKTIFQAFMMSKEKKNPLLLLFLVSFLINNPYTYMNGPCYDMYNCLYYNIDEVDLKTDIRYDLQNVKIKIHIGPCIQSEKVIDLHYFPDITQNIVIGSSESNIKIIKLKEKPFDNYKIELNKNPYNDKFNFSIENDNLIVQRLDTETGWGYDHTCKIIDNTYKIECDYNEVDFDIRDNRLFIYKKRTDYEVLHNLNNGWNFDLFCYIVIDTQNSFYLFKENYDPQYLCKVTYKDTEILQSRDSEYQKNKSW